MPVALEEALSRVREALLGDRLVRAVASGRCRGHQPPWRRVELRPVDLKSGRHLQATSYDATQAHTRNAGEGAEATAMVDDLLAVGFGSWHVETEASTLQLRVTKKGAGQLHETPRDDAVAAPPAHDRVKQRLLDPADPWMVKVKPSRQAKDRQVEEFCRQLATVVDGALANGQLRTPTTDDPLRVVDLGCGNAYLTFAAYRWLSHVRGLPVTMTGVDAKAAARERNSVLAAELDATALSFVHADIAAVRVEPSPEVVLALHACDTATDDALARALEWA
ncbi:MAG: SAM-dependent methyltransferase, partial [Actinomycetota bacterium]|nr:SAM-dependent methyltransferase [Actinomycetota bacterium]